MRFSFTTLFFMLCFGLFTMAPQNLTAADEVTKTEFADSMAELVAKFKAADFENMSKREQRRFMRANMKDMVKHAPHLVKNQSSLSPRMRRGIVLFAVGFVITIVGYVLAAAVPGRGWLLYWLFYLIGYILMTVGAIIILLELLEML